MNNISIKLNLQTINIDFLINNFEKEYYESDHFWGGGMLQDEANKTRIKLTAALIPTTTKNIVDIGCGNGVFINYLLNENPKIDITGVDRSETALSYVRSKKMLADINNLPFTDKEFDCVTCLQVIEHLPEPIYQKSLDELARYLLIVL